MAIYTYIHTPTQGLYTHILTLTQGLFIHIYTYSHLHKDYLKRIHTRLHRDCLYIYVHLHKDYLYIYNTYSHKDCLCIHTPTQGLFIHIHTHTYTRKHAHQSVPYHPLKKTLQLMKYQCFLNNNKTPFESLSSPPPPPPLFA